MAISVHHNRIGFCYLIGDQPMDWQLTYKAAQSPEQVKIRIFAWLKFYRPSMVLTEDLSGSKRKGRKAQSIILAVKEAVIDNGFEHEEVSRKQPFANKYQQIDHLCERFPQMKVIQPAKRRIYDAEPSYITLFEALAMAVQYLEQSGKGSAPTDLPI